MSFQTSKLLSMNEMMDLLIMSYFVFLQFPYFAWYHEFVISYSSFRSNGRERERERERERGKKKRNTELILKMISRLGTWAKKRKKKKKKKREKGKKNGVRFVCRRGFNTQTSAYKSRRKDPEEIIRIVTYLGFKGHLDSRHASLKE